METTKIFENVVEWGVGILCLAAVLYRAVFFVVGFLTWFFGWLFGVLGGEL
jgi:hypothetical protein